MALTNDMRSWLFIIPLVPSILVSIFNLYHLLGNRALRKGLNNHVLILLLLCGLIEEVTDIIWQIYSLRTNAVLSSTTAYCLSWSFIGLTTLVSNFILMAWASIERHILIFYPNWFGTHRKRLFFHYLPLAACIVWPGTFYLVTLVILPCNKPLVFTNRFCSHYACIVTGSVAGYMDSILNYIIPSFTIVVFSLALFARVIYTRYRIRGRIDWRNYKKMALQLLPISTLYLALQFPPYFLYAAYTGGLSRSVGVSYYATGVFFSYWVVLFTPFATVLSLPELKTKCKKLLFWRKRRAVQPEMLAMKRRNVGQTIAEVPVAGGRATVAPAVMTAAAAVATTAMAPAAVATTAMAPAAVATTVMTPAPEATAPAAVATTAMTPAPEATASAAVATAVMTEAPEATAPTAVATTAMTEAPEATASAAVATAVMTEAPEATAPAAVATAVMTEAPEATAPAAVALGAMISTSMGPAAMRIVEMPPIDI